MEEQRQQKLELKTQALQREKVVATKAEERRQNRWALFWLLVITVVVSGMFYLRAGWKGGVQIKLNWEWKQAWPWGGEERLKFDGE